MGHRFAQTIQIGGVLAYGDVGTLANAVAATRCDTHVHLPHDLSIATWLAELADGGAITMESSESGGHDFDALIVVCERTGLAYDVHSETYEGRAAADPYVMRWRPGMAGAVESPTLGFGGEIAVERGRLVAILSRHRDRVREYYAAEERRPPASMAGKVLDELERELGMDVPDLPPFTIAEATDGGRQQREAADSTP